MTIFEQVKAAVPLKDAAERYGFKVTRTCMICCPFHNDSNPSMKLNSSYFYCFGCGENGDVIDFVNRLFDIKPIDAAKKLAVDFGLDYAAGDAVVRPQVYHKADVYSDRERECFGILCDYLHLLEEWKITFAPKTPDEDFDDRFVEACQRLGYIEYLIDFIIDEDIEDRHEVVNELITDGTIGNLRKRIEKIREENRYEQYEQ
ncbi:MAG: CHC2 zinc finger domain-containing protein [Oscillospiraceae bacterium]|nr:CHC2 zinc finger domain-containing protein [Oscillospiraceae bacterium]